MDIEDYSDVDLVSELVRRNGTHTAPNYKSLGSKFREVLVCINKDETAYLIFHENAEKDIGAGL